MFGLADIAKITNMKRISPGDSCVQPETNAIDWNAIIFLQRKRRVTRKGFNLDSIEYALDKLLQLPDRKSAGKQLAKDLFRDGKRVTASSQGLIGRSLINKQTYHYLEPKDVEQAPVKDASIHIAIQVVTLAFKNLSHREMLALQIRSRGNVSGIDIDQLLGVSTRQYRNILNQARASLRSYPGFTEAYFLLYINSDDSDIKSFFSDLINNIFTANLS